MQHELRIEDLDGRWPHDERRLAVCMAASTAFVLLVLALLEWPPADGLVRLAPPVLDVILERGPRAQAPSVQEDARAESPPAAPAEPAVDVPAADVPAPITAAPDEVVQQARPEQRAEAAPAPASAAEGVAGPPKPVDWYAELERAAAAIGERAAAEPQSMHPKFDELRRIAKLFYGEPKANPPAETWEVEKDPYGRTLLKKGPFFQVLDDPRLFNREAFEIFERHMIFVSIPLGRRKPKNLPWVEAIRARYEYLREPDELPPLKAVAAPAAEP